MKPDRPMIDRLIADRMPGPREIHSHVTRPIVEQLVKAGAHTVLELGCGDGWFTAALDRCGFAATGLDREESHLQVARHHYPHLKFHAGDAMHALDPELLAGFDAVIAIDLVDHVPHSRRLVSAALSALKPGGLLVLTSNFHGYSKNLALAFAGRFDSRWDPLTDEGQLKFFSRSTLTSLFKEFGLVELHFETVGRIPMFARAMLMSGRASP